MRFPGRDIIATGLVAVAGLVYVLWASGSPLAGLSGTRASGVVILVLGFAASASAVVPGFDQLLHGNKIYLAVTAFLGVVALFGGVTMRVAASDTGLGVLMGTMLVLWLVATVHHMLLARSAAPTDTHASRHGAALRH